MGDILKSAFIRNFGDGQKGILQIEARYGDPYLQNIRFGRSAHDGLKNPVKIPGTHVALFS